jgi:hypothetical protein
LLTQWQKDTWVNWAYRSADPILTRIDNIVEALNNTGSDGDLRYLYGELYFATNAWLKSLQLGENPKMEKDREPGVRALCHYAITWLAAAFGVGVQALPTKLEQFYGESMSDHGRLQDSPQMLGTEHYMDRARTEKFRVYFKNGLAYQYYTYDPKNQVLVLLDSEHWSSSDPDSKRKITLTMTDPESQEKTQVIVSVLDPDWAYFVMSMGRDIYLGPHMKLTKTGIYALVHSSWLGGAPVQFSGSMLVEKGVIKGIRTNSGHYRPTDEHLVNVLEFLQTMGVDLTQVSVYDYAGQDFDVNGDEFLEERGNWASIVKRSKANPEVKPPRLKPFKMKYKCPVCGKTYESNKAPVYCQYDHSSCAPV